MVQQNDKKSFKKHKPTTQRKQQTSTSGDSYGRPVKRKTI